MQCERSYELTHPLFSSVVTSAETPLKGGERVVLEEGTGFQSHQPRSSAMTTPNVIFGAGQSAPGGATPLTSSRGDTPMSSRSGSTARSAMPGSSTPMRDQLGLNQGQDMQLMLLSEKRR
jgi:hypothetical protein